MLLRQSPSSGVASGIADNVASVRHVTVHNRTRCHLTIVAQPYSGQDYRARADECSISNIRMEIEASSHVVGQHHSMMVDHTIPPNMYAFGPSSVNQRSGRDPSAGIDIHPPKARLHKSLPALFQRSRHWLPDGMICHVRHLHDEDGASNAHLRGVSG